MRKVKWSIRDDGNSTWSKHYCGDYVVFCTDCDGDGTEWSVWLRDEYEMKLPDEELWKRQPLAKGYVSPHGDDFEVGQAIAIEALDSLVRNRADRERQEEEDRKRNAAISARLAQRRGEGR